MPGPAIDEIELIIEDIRGGGGKPPSRDGDDDGGDEGSGGDQAPEPRQPNSKKYSSAVLIGIASIVRLVMVLTAAFVALRVNNSHNLAGIRMPRILWLNTAVLLLSRATLQTARPKFP